MVVRVVRDWDCFVAGEGGGSSVSVSVVSLSELLGEGEEGGDVEKVVGGFWVRFRWFGLCCCCCEMVEVEVVAADDEDIRGVVALSVMWMASEGCLAGRLAMVGWLAGEAGWLAPCSFGLAGREGSF